MTMVNVPQGKFVMGSAEGEPDEAPVHEVYLDTFWMDLTEVTNAMYALCVEARFLHATHGNRFLYATGLLWQYKICKLSCHLR